jgi:hypothetical protein
MTLNITTFSIAKIKPYTRNKDTQHNDSIVMLSAIYAECRK